METKLQRIIGLVDYVTMLSRIRSNPTDYITSVGMHILTDIPYYDANVVLDSIDTLKGVR